MDIGPNCFIDVYTGARPIKLLHGPDGCTYGGRSGRDGVMARPRSGHDGETFGEKNHCARAWPRPLVCPLGPSETHFFPTQLTRSGEFRVPPATKTARFQ